MDLQAQTDEEVEVLLSIYSGDDRFRKIDNRTFQYRVESDDTSSNSKSFMLQIKWTDNYPEAPPDISLDIFYNSHLPDSVKDDIRSRLQEEANVWLGSAMTYTLFEYAKENIDTLLPAGVLLQTNREDKEQENPVSDSVSKNVQFALDNANAGKPRGWNWVDIVKHLNQTGASSLVPST
ncbi:hypothetical protein RvY_07908 [Ramazzottius varieornatus]|uniref:RWD domain-containing protein n=1 Tax=Ramazzottius varieornatus TaxID=947166 RepID=A0A1D1V3Y1_RAMVA|nr:hypothetical protein RvY_07908 [Ramazzottius varieornatus]